MLRRQNFIRRVIQSTKRLFIRKIEQRTPFFKGKIRPYYEAVALDVVDKRVARLVATLNHPGLAMTVGSCEGHGFPFITVPPYVSFRSDITLARMLADFLRTSSESDAPPLNYHWELVARFNADHALTFVLEILTLTLNKRPYVTRAKLDQDFDTLSMAWEEILDSRNIDEAEIKSNCHTYS